MAGPGPWYVYILECRNGAYYTGVATDVERRFEEHSRQKRGARYTRSNPPLRIVYREPAANRSLALRREAALKRLDRTQKVLLAKAFLSSHE